MTRPAPSLFLVSPVIADPAAFRPLLEVAVGTGEVAALLLRFAPCDERGLVNRLKLLAPVAQERDVAVLLADMSGPFDIAQVAARGGADGVHVLGPDRAGDLLTDGRRDRTVGVGGLESRHDAMSAGELGVDYVLFGDPRPGSELPPDLEDTLELASWWAEIFETPCVALAPTLEAVTPLARTGAEFVGLGDAVWGSPDGPASAVAAARRAMLGAQVPA